jgi:glycosyltransferase involved in cell wall biosynthesis
LEPLVSVVVPSYNRGHVIAETLESIFAQTYPRLEIIVVDDGSTDNTTEALGRYRGRVNAIRQVNQGLAAARNTGLAASTGTYVAWLDSDDLWNPSKIALQVAFMQAHPAHAVIASDFSAFDADGFFERSHVAAYYSVLGRTPGGLAGFFPDQLTFSTAGLPYMGADVPDQVRVYSGHIYEKMVGGNCLHPPTVMFRREAGTRAGNLDPAFRNETDYEFFVRLSQQGQAAFIDHPLMRYRYSPDQMSSDAQLKKMAQGRALVLDSLKTRDPALLQSPAFRRRLGSSHLDLAAVLSEESRGTAAVHLVRSLAWGYVDANTVRTVAKLVLPGWVVRRLRKQPAEGP